jgi:acetyl esterase/lipase
VTEPVVPQDVSVLRDVVHTRVEGYRPLSLDLYLPETPRAICVYVHGGGWRVGSRRVGPSPQSPTSWRSFGQLAHRGLAVAAVDYRLSGEAQFPAQAQDVQAAVRWLLDDPASPVRDLPLVLFGGSSGGHLAALCALDQSLPVRAAALWFPVTDLLAMPDDIDAVGADADRGPGSREAALLGGPAAERPELARAASPVHHVHAGAPPMLILHGDADRSVPFRQGERLRDALHAVGADCRLEVVPGRDHLFAGMPDDEIEALVDRTAAFLLGAAS